MRIHTYTYTDSSVAQQRRILFPAHTAFLSPSKILPGTSRLLLGVVGLLIAQVCIYMCVCLCVCTRARARVCVCVYFARARVRVCIQRCILYIYKVKTTAGSSRAVDCRSIYMCMCVCVYVCMCVCVYV